MGNPNDFYPDAVPLTPIQKQRNSEASFIREIRSSINKPKDYYELLAVESGVKSGRVLESALIVIVAIVLCVFLIAGCTTEAVAEITEEQAVKCILGEARGEGYASLLAHSEAIRARGTLKGVYGCRAKISPTEAVYMQKKGIVALAHKAWKESAHTNTVKKAQYWGSLIYDKKWINTMERAGYIKTAVIKNTAFYREVRNE